MKKVKKETETQRRKGSKTFCKKKTKNRKIKRENANMSNKKIEERKDSLKDQGF